MINLNYINNISKANSARKEIAPPQIPRTSDKTVRLVQETLSNSPLPVLLLKNTEGQTLYPAPYSLEAVPETERQNIVQLAHLLITDTMNGAEIAEIYRALANILPSERVTLVQNALSLCNSDMGAVEKVSILDAIKDIPQELRARTVYHARFLITPAMNAVDVCDILDATKKLLFPEERENIVLVDYPFRQEEEPLERVLSPEDRVSIVSLVNSLINRTMNGEAVLELLEQVKDLPTEERAHIVTQANFLITREMDAAAVATILGAIEALPAHQREIARFANRLVTAQTHPIAKIAILKALIPIPTNERNDIIEHTIRLIPVEMGTENRATAIQTLASIPKDQRVRAVTLACETPDAKRRIALIRALQED